MIAESLQTLKINILSDKQYEREDIAGNIKTNELYLTPDDDYTNEEIDSKLDEITNRIKQLSSGGLTRQIMSELPEKSKAEETVIYMVGPKEDKTYEEYMYVADKNDFELIGTTEIEINDASTTQKGIVKLSNETTSTSQTEAATSKAVKDAIDNLVTDLGDGTVNVNHAIYADNAVNANTANNANFAEHSIQAEKAFDYAEFGSIASHINDTDIHLAAGIKSQLGNAYKKTVSGKFLEIGDISPIPHNVIIRARSEGGEDISGVNLIVNSFNRYPIEKTYSPSILEGDEIYIHQMVNDGLNWVESGEILRGKLIIHDLSTFAKNVSNVSGTYKIYRYEDPFEGAHRFDIYNSEGVKLHSKLNATEIGIYYDYGYNYQSYTYITFRNGENDAIINIESTYPTLRLTTNKDFDIILDVEYHMDIRDLGAICDDKFNALENDFNNKLDTYATKAELDNYVTKSMLKDDTDPFIVQQAEIASYATNALYDNLGNEIVTTYATKAQLSNYASKAELDNYATKEQISDLGGGDMLKSVYDKNGDGIVDNAKKLDNKDASYFASKAELDNYVTKSSLLDEDNYITVQEAQGARYADKASNDFLGNDIISTYATKAELQTAIANAITAALNTAV